MSVRDQLKSIGDSVELSKSKRDKNGWLWSGPDGKGSNGGITFSLLSRYLVCKERFRILVKEGLKSGEGFSHRLHYGQMWHECEEAYGKALSDPTTSKNWKSATEARLNEYLGKLYRQYPLSRELIEHWGCVCWKQFPIYVDYWNRSPEKIHRVPVLSEEKFNVWYRLPSGRKVRLRGKWDSVDVIGRSREACIFLQENKTKGDIDERQIKKQLRFDLQTMIYLTALTDKHEGTCSYTAIPQGLKVAGVRYNIIKRPLSGGKGTIVRKKATKTQRAESKSEFYDRLAQYIKDDPSSYFMRWTVHISQEDILKFRRECLDPVLEQLCDWWSWVSKTDDPFSPNDGCENSLDRPVSSYVHFKYPYGVWNPLLEGASTDLDEYIETGSELGLTRTTTLFPELE